MYFRDVQLGDAVVTMNKGYAREGIVAGRSNRLEEVIVIYKKDQDDTCPYQTFPNGRKIYGNENWSDYFDWIDKSIINTFHSWCKFEFNEVCSNAIKIISPDLKCSNCNLPSPHAVPNINKNYICLPCNIFREL